jgi:hypothetical protein
VNTKKFDELREAARRKAQELEDRFEIRRKVELGFNAATDAAIKATEAVGDMASAAREQAATIDKDLGVSDNLRAGAGPPKRRLVTSSDRPDLLSARRTGLQQEPEGRA